MVSGEVKLVLILSQKVCNFRANMTIFAKIKKEPQTIATLQHFKTIILLFRYNNFPVVQFAV